MDTSSAVDIHSPRQELKRGKRPSAPNTYVNTANDSGRPKTPGRSKSSDGVSLLASPGSSASSDRMPPRRSKSNSISGDIDRKPPRRSKSSDGFGDVTSLLSKGNGDRKPPRRSKSNNGVANLASNLSKDKDDDRKPPRRSKSGDGLLNLSNSLSKENDNVRKPPRRSKSNDGLTKSNEKDRKLPSRSRSGTGITGSSGHDRKPPGRSKSSQNEGKSKVTLGSHLKKSEDERKALGRNKSFSSNKSAPVTSIVLVEKKDNEEQPRRYKQRSRSMSPTRMSDQRQRGRSKTRSRSKSPSRIGTKSRGRSSDATGATRSRSLSRADFEYPSQNPKDNGQRGKRRTMMHGLSIRNLKNSHLTWCKLAHYIIPAFILVGATIGLIFATGNGSIITDTIDAIIPTFDNSELNDPLRGNRAPSWPSDREGLKATVINALSQDWQVTFALAVADWNDGDPNAVQISEEAADHDPHCKAPEGKIVVCNGDYGDTKWRGITESMSNPRGKLVLAEARLNEYYLLNMEKGAWQYTMCHELGHTIGLGHTDEDFENEDLGDCMDYTDNLDANKHPTELNYNTLFRLYGPIGGKDGKDRLLERASRLRGRTSNDGEDARVSKTGLQDSLGLVPGTETVHSIRERTDSKHSLRKNHKGMDIATATRIETIPPYIRQQKEEAVATLLERIRTEDDEEYRRLSVGHVHRDGWKLMHRKKHGEEHVMELGEGYTVRVELLRHHVPTIH